MPRLYDNKKRTWRNIPTIVWWLYRLVRSNRFGTAIISNGGFNFTGARKITVISIDKDFK